MVEKYRPTKDEYYLNIAKETAQRSTCMSVKGGAVIIKDDQVIATGYVGAPRGTLDCFERGNCLRRQMGIPSGQRYEICRSVHAEENALISAARSGTSVLGGTLYLYFVKRQPDGTEKFAKAFPCFLCKKKLINAGLKRFVGNDENGKIASYDIDDWIKAWATHDMLDDTDKYDSKYSAEEAKAASNKK
ncbi:MAG: dCMP deaminase family protein [archaeon]